MKLIEGWDLTLGILLIMGGAMPLNGYIGFQIHPETFVKEPFIGSLGHLLFGLLPYLMGITLTIRTPAKILTNEALRSVVISVTAIALCLMPLMIAGTFKWNEATSLWSLLMLIAIIAVSLGRILKYRMGTKKA